MQAKICGYQRFTSPSDFYTPDFLTSRRGNTKMEGIRSQKQTLCGSRKGLRMIQIGNPHSAQRKHLFSQAINLFRENIKSFLPAATSVSNAGNLFRTWTLMSRRMSACVSTMQRTKFRRKICVSVSEPRINVAKFTAELKLSNQLLNYSKQNQCFGFNRF